MNKRKLTKVFIVDDNRDAIEVLRRMLETNFSVEVVGTAMDAEEAKRLITKVDPDMIFLDIELPSMSGLQFWTEIQSELKPNVKVVFYTGHDKYLLEALRRQAFDYLMKPPTEHELNQLMTRYYESKLSERPVKLMPCESTVQILVVNPKNEHLTLHLSDTAFFRYNSERLAWEVVCMDGKVYLLRHRTNADVIMNYSPDLVQIHKRYIVNINQVKMIQDALCVLNEPMDHNRELRISKNYRAVLMSAFYAM